MLIMTKYLLLLWICTIALAYPVEEKESEEDKIPYSFSYAASRHFGGHPDREHKESRGPDGITRGVFRFVDPNLKIQEIVYQSDDDGFHVDASNIPEDTVAVAQAKSHHQNLFEKISQDHARIGEELRLAASKDSNEESNIQDQSQSSKLVYVPQESESVKRARERHANLFTKTIQDHAAISEELKKAEEEAEKLKNHEDKLREEKGEDAFIPARPYEEPEEKISSLTNYLPKNTRIVAARRKTHQQLFERIVEQHSRLAEELREKERLSKLNAEASENE